MTKKEKLLDKLLSSPKDFTFNEAKTLLGQYGFSEVKLGKTSGSRVRFHNEKTGQVLTMHKPHGKKAGSVLKQYQIKDIEKVILNYISLKEK